MQTLTAGQLCDEQAAVQQAASLSAVGNKPHYD